MTIYKKLNLDEFNKAEQLLKEKGIKYERKDYTQSLSMFDMGDYEKHTIKNYGDDWLWDFICSHGTYGAEEGLLEYWSKKMSDDEIDPIGWLTAEEVVEKIEAGI